MRFSLKFEGCFQEISGRSGTLVAVAAQKLVSQEQGYQGTAG